MTQPPNGSKIESPIPKRLSPRKIKELCCGGRLTILTTEHREMIDLVYYHEKPIGRRRTVRALSV